MSSTPGFFAVFWRGETVGEVGEVLEGVGYLNLVGKACADRCFESFGEVFADDKDDFGKSGTDGVED